MKETTIGQDFAARWLIRNYDQHKEAGAPEELFRDIASAVDAYVAKKTGELERQLLKVALGTVQGDTPQGEVKFGSRELVQDQALVALAKRWPRKTMDQVTTFPV